MLCEDTGQVKPCEDDHKKQDIRIWRTEFGIYVMLSGITISKLANYLAGPQFLRCVVGFTICMTFDDLI